MTSVSRRPPLPHIVTPPLSSASRGFDGSGSATSDQRTEVRRAQRLVDHAKTPAP